MWVCLSIFYLNSPLFHPVHAGVSLPAWLSTRDWSLRSVFRSVGAFLLLAVIWETCTRNLSRNEVAWGEGRREIQTIVYQKNYPWISSRRWAILETDSIQIHSWVGRLSFRNHGVPTTSSLLPPLLFSLPSFLFLVTPGGVQGLLLALCSRTTDGSVWETICVAGD